MTCALGGVRLASPANLFAWANFGAALETRSDVAAAPRLR